MQSPRIDFESLIRSSPQGICGVDPRLRIRFVNPRFLSLLGYERETELLRRDFTDLLDEEGRRVYASWFERRSAGLAETFRLHLRRRDRGGLSALVSAVPLFEGGGFSGSFGTFHDFEELRLHFDPLEGRLAHFEELAKDSSLPMLALGPGASLRYANGAAATLLGLGKGRGDPVALLASQLPEGEGRNFEARVRAALAGEPGRPFFLRRGARPEGWPQSLCSLAPALPGSPESGLFIILAELQDGPLVSQLEEDPYYLRLQLSYRERLVAQLLLAGLLYKEIAHGLGVSLSTVRSHVERVYAKAGVHSRAELARSYLEHQGEREGRAPRLRLFKAFFPFVGTI